MGQFLHRVLLNGSPVAGIISNDPGIVSGLAVKLKNSEYKKGEE